MGRLRVTAAIIMVIALCSIVFAAVGVWHPFGRNAYPTASTVNPSPLSTKNPPPREETKQGISGTVSYGPISPVCLVNETGPSPTPSYASSIKIVVLAASSGEVLVPIDWVVMGGCELRGTFQVNLKIGTYSLDLTTCASAPFRYFGCNDLPIKVEVKPNTFVPISIDVDTGIR